MCPLWSIKKTQEPVEDYSVEFGFKVTSAFFFNLEHPPSLKKIINFFFFFCLDIAILEEVGPVVL